MARSITLEVFAVAPSGINGFVLVKARYGRAVRAASPFAAMPTAGFAEYHFLVPEIDAQEYPFGARVYVLTSLVPQTEADRRKEKLEMTPPGMESVLDVMVRNERGGACKHFVKKDMHCLACTGPLLPPKNVTEGDTTAERC